MTVELSDEGVLQDGVALERAASGDREAFGVLYERYVGRIYNYIYYRTGNPYDAGRSDGGGLLPGDATNFRLRRSGSADVSLAVPDRT